MREDRLWSLLSTGVAVAAGVTARKCAVKAYERQLGKPPMNPDDPDVKWRDALVWGAATGMLAGVARVVGRRAGQEAVRRARGASRARKVLD
ncbi:DUF4235 domain-containing protein, partial [Halomonas sp. BBD48]|nr:DUF4235 domain-containing protein [Halomonas sp. BBD48]